MNKVAAEPAMIASVVVAIFLAMFQQDRNILDILESFQNGYKMITDHDGLNLLVNRGGIQSMMWTLSLALFALTLGGILDAAGYLAVLLRALLLKLKGVVSTMAATMCTGFLSVLSVGESYIAIIVTAQLFKDKYAELRLKPYMLSRTIEESTTLAAPIIPWSTAGAFYFGAMGVPVFDYLPWAFLCYLNGFISLGLAYVGFGVFRYNDDQDELVPDE